MNVGRLRSALVVIAVVISGCSLGATLERLREEPMLGTPPEARELLRTEIAGTKFGFGTSARVEIVWGMVDVDEVTGWYLQEHGDRYGLNRQAHSMHWLGERAVGDMTVTTSVQVLSGIADLQWESMIGAEEDVGAWDGPVLAVRVSSTGP